MTDYTTFTALCLLIRGIGALGSSAYSTASYVFVISTFPDNISSVIVSYVTSKRYSSIIVSILGYFRNLCRTRNEYWSSIRRVVIFGMSLYYLSLFDEVLLQ